MHNALAADVTSVINSILSAIGVDLLDVRRSAGRLLAIWVMAWLGWQLIKWVADRIVVTADDHHAETITLREKRAETVSQLFRSAGFGVLVVVAGMETLKEFMDIKPLLGISGVLALAVSFGAQSLVKDYFAGFFILFESQFVVGDSIEAAGKTGVVEKLTLRTVRLRDIEGVVHIIPNGQITTLSNKTRGWSRAVVDVGVSYENDIDRVIAVMKEEGERFNTDHTWTDRIDAPPEVLGVESFGDNGVSVRVLLRTKPGRQGEVAREFRRRVLIRLEREGIKGARSQQTINIQSGVPLPSAASPPADGGPLPIAGTT